MNRHIAVMLMALCAFPDAQARRNERTDADWWSAFVLEMEGIGAHVIGEDEHGEIEFACPAEVVEKAKAIVARYSAKRRAK
jgi:hypothetical protein